MGRYWTESRQARARVHGLSSPYHDVFRYCDPNGAGLFLPSKMLQHSHLSFDRGVDPVYRHCAAALVVTGGTVTLYGYNWDAQAYARLLNKVNDYLQWLCKAVGSLHNSVLEKMGLFPHASAAMAMALGRARSKEYAAVMADGGRLVARETGASGSSGGRNGRGARVEPAMSYSVDVRDREARRGASPVSAGRRPPAHFNRFAGGSSRGGSSRGGGSSPRASGSNKAGGGGSGGGSGSGTGKASGASAGGRSGSSGPGRRRLRGVVPAMRICDPRFAALADPIKRQSKHLQAVLAVEDERRARAQADAEAHARWATKDIDERATVEELNAVLRACRVVHLSLAPIHFNLMSAQVRTAVALCWRVVCCVCVCVCVRVCLFVCMCV